MTNIGAILSELREERGLTQRELAEIFHLSTSTISAYETGTRMPVAENIIAYARYFDVTADYVLGLSSSLTPPSVLEEELQAGVTIGTTVEYIRTLLPTQRVSLLNILHDLSVYAEMAQKTELGEGNKL